MAWRKANGSSDRHLRAAALALGLCLCCPAAAGAAAEAPALNIQVSSAEVTHGASVTVAGGPSGAAQPLAGAVVELQASPYPYRAFSTIATTTSGVDGSFAFASFKPDRNTHLRVVAQASPQDLSRQLTVVVDPAVSINAHSQGPGRTRLSMRVEHTLAGASPPVSVWWFVTPRGGGLFRLAAVTSTRELSAGLTYASATIDPPARRFAYRVCFNPSWEADMGRRGAHGPCPHQDYAVEDHGD